MRSAKVDKMPGYRKQKQANGRIVGYVTLGEKRIYLPGKFNSPESRQAYEATIAEWLARGKTLATPDGITIAELCSRFIAHAKEYYRIGQEADQFRYPIRVLCGLYSTTLAAEFGPLKLKACREAMIQKGWARRNINFQINRIRRMFKWAVCNEMVSGEVLHGLQALDGLRAGRSEAKEMPPVMPIPWEVASQINGHVPPIIFDMMTIQYLTGCRPGEVVAIKTADIDRKGEVWQTALADHKTAYRGKKRTLFFGKRAQAILEPYLLRRPFGFVFSPWDAIRAKSERSTVHRRSNQKANRKKTARTIGDYYTVDSYRRAITAGCKRAGIDHFHPHRLRHTRATEIRAQFGLDAAQSVLGHAHAAVTEIYGMIDDEKARRIMSQIG